MKKHHLFFVFFSSVASPAAVKPVFAMLPSPPFFFLSDYYHRPPLRPPLTFFSPCDSGGISIFHLGRVLFYQGTFFSHAYAATKKKKKMRRDSIIIALSHSIDDTMGATVKFNKIIKEKKNIEAVKTFYSIWVRHILLSHASPLPLPTRRPPLLHSASVLRLTLPFSSSYRITVLAGQSRMCTGLANRD